MRRRPSNNLSRLLRLEDRITPVASGLVAVGSQPTGGLPGKIVYLNAGHGDTADNLGTGAWSFQRGENFEIIEDLGNQDQMTFLADYLFHAGATVVPLRPVGHQTNEVVLDNDDPGVTFSGAWSNSASNIFFGSAGDVPYRFASTSPTETAFARYQPNIPQSGFYPVYAWVRAGTDRATDQLFRVNHAGGITEVKVNFRRVGNGMIYLGTYYFNAGTAGYVDISNRSNSAGSVVIADMIRFGNGMGDINRGGGVSGLPREDEAGLYWIQWEVDHSQGIDASNYRTLTDDADATVSATPRYAAYMNQSGDGSLSDRVFVSFHSNAAGGRGTLGLYNGNNYISSRTPNQILLASSLGQEVNDDLVAQAGLYEHNWFNAGTNTTLDRSDIEFGEINNTYINNEFDATIVEVAYHDNQLDAELMRDPKVRDAVGRATYQGLIKYFRGVDSNATSATALPAAVAGVRAESNAVGNVTISWVPPTSNSYLGDAATGYRVYASTNGYAFDGGTAVAGGATTSVTLSGYDPNTPYYFKVVAVNAGGESTGSEVLAVLPIGGPKQVLIVNGFDRLDRTEDPKQPYGAAPNTVDRVRPRQSNSRDYTVQVASALQAAKPGVRFNSVSNEAVISGAVNLANYKMVVWILGEESTANRTFDATEQTKVEAYVAGGGNLFLSGAEIAWDLDSQNDGRTFYRSTLKGLYVADDAGTYSANGSASGIFSGLSLSFDNGSQFYDAEFPDVINPQAGAQTAMTYSNGAGGAAIQAAGTGGRGSVVMLAFPFETITTAANRTAVMSRVLNYFNVSPVPPPTVAAVQVNDSNAQRSEVRSLSVTFSTQVTIAGNPFTVTRIGGSAVGLVIGTPTLDGQGRTVVTLTFSGAGVDTMSGTTTPSLADGIYRLTIADGAVTGAGLALDGDGNGSASGAYTSPTDTAAGGTGQLRLFRLYGDATGDGGVDALDLQALRPAINTSIGDGSYVAYMDANNDGAIDSLDLNVLRSTINTSLFSGGAPQGKPAASNPDATDNPATVSSTTTELVPVAPAFGGGGIVAAGGAGPGGKRTPNGLNKPNLADTVQGPGEGLDLDQLRTAMNSAAKHSAFPMAFDMVIESDPGALDLFALQPTITTSLFGPCNILLRNQPFIMP
jgi:hypothetical protein